MTKRKNISCDDDDFITPDKTVSVPVLVSTSESTSESASTPKHNRKRVKFETLPENINSIGDLIKIGKSGKFYKNLDIIMLWDILPYLIELDLMIGMENVKTSVFYQVIYYLQNLHTRSEGDYLHTIITGKPGCGKTSVAKIIGKIYQNLGILSKHGKFKIATRPDFVGEYLGSTAVKTKKLLTSCLGGVLFVDEIYALGNQEKRDSFAKEAIDVINVFLSEHKNDFCFIGAGYKDEIEKCFFAYNEGLSRRFPWRHDIQGYTSDNLADILLKMVREMNWEINVNKNDIINIIGLNEELFVDAGGSIETLLSKIKLTHSKRVFGKEKELKFIITIDDIENAVRMVKQFSKKKEKKFSAEMMYI